MKELELNEIEQVVGGDITTPPAGWQSFLDQQAASAAAALARKLAGQIH